MLEKCLNGHKIAQKGRNFIAPPALILQFHIIHFFHIVLSVPETSPYYHHECILLSQPYFLTTYMRWSVAGHLKQPGKKDYKEF